MDRVQAIINTRRHHGEALSPPLSINIEIPSMFEHCTCILNALVVYFYAWWLVKSSNNFAHL